MSKFQITNNKLQTCGEQSRTIITNFQFSKFEFEILDSRLNEIHFGQVFGIWYLRLGVCL